MQALEGYHKEGLFYPINPPINLPDYKRVIITILDEHSPQKSDTWDKLDKIVSEMDEKPKFEDFPRLDLERPLIDFDEV